MPGMKFNFYPLSRLNGFQKPLPNDLLDKKCMEKKKKKNWPRLFLYIFVNNITKSVLFY